MNPQDEASLRKNMMIIDMAISFSAMNRVFEKRSKEKIVEKLENSFAFLADVESKDDFEKIHSEFCEWFIKNVRTSKKDRENKNSNPASYGQAAKMFNVATKVYVYYCQLPSCESSTKLIPMLHAAVDTQMMKYLKDKCREDNFKASTIEAVGLSEYITLQKLVDKNIQDEFMNLIRPVHWDDIIWYRLNRPSEQFVEENISGECLVT
jgi:hypothetical protein